jgi:hypothetical protein
MDAVEYVKSRPLVEALFWYIENSNDCAPEVFFALRERFRDEYQSQTESTIPFPTMLRKMWSGGEVQKWLDDYVVPLLQKRDAALRHIVRVMGPLRTPSCCGCNWEWTEALNTAREALGLKEPTDETSPPAGSDTTR